MFDITNRIMIMLDIYLRLREAINQMKIKSGARKKEKLKTPGLQAGFTPVHPKSSVHLKQQK